MVGNGNFMSDNKKIKDDNDNVLHCLNMFVYIYHFSSKVATIIVCRRK